MASSSNHNLEGSIDEMFDQYFDQQFDQTSENLCNIYGGQEEERRARKK